MFMELSVTLVLVNVPNYALSNFKKDLCAVLDCIELNSPNT